MSQDLSFSNRRFKLPTIAIFTAAVDTLEPKITSLDQFVRAGVGPYREVAGFELTEYDKGATLAGLPAHKVTFVMPYQDLAFSKTISYFAMMNNTGYGISYLVSSTKRAGGYIVKFSIVHLSNNGRFI